MLLTLDSDSNWFLSIFSRSTFCTWSSYSTRVYESVFSSCLELLVDHQLVWPNCSCSQRPLWQIERDRVRECIILLERWKERWFAKCEVCVVRGFGYIDLTLSIAWIQPPLWLSCCIFPSGANRFRSNQY